MSQQEFDELYDRHRGAVFRFAFSLTRNHGEAEDLFQETWVRVARSFPKVLDMKKVKSWLFTITSNLYKDSLRRRRTRRLFLFQKKWAGDQAMSVCETFPHGESLSEMPGSERVEMGRAISQALSRLPEQFRLVFMLKEIAGFKQSEISEILGIPVGTVKSMMFRAVKKLRHDLDAYHPGKNQTSGRGLHEK